jgi:hypothetical protein
MFSYNPFWHFWHTLNNRNYSRIFMTTILLAILALVAVSFLFPMVSIPLWSMVGIVLAPTLIIATGLFTLRKLSNFFYNRQNQKLESLKREILEEKNPLGEEETLSVEDMEFNEQRKVDILFNEQIDLYLNRRVVCPPELLAGKVLSFPKAKVEHQIQHPLMTEEIGNLRIAKRNTPLAILNRNDSYEASSKAGECIFIKETAALDGLSEVSAREMAELMGLHETIPANTVARKPETESLSESVDSRELLTSRQAVAEYIERKNEARTGEAIRNTPGVHNAVAKFIFNMKTAVYRRQAQEGKLSDLLYLQEIVPNAVDGTKIQLDLAGASLDTSSTESSQTRIARAKHVIRNIDLVSFQENFLLQIVLGAQDCNLGNTLFVETATGQKLYSIDHERIMPEDNYNVTKSIPIINGADMSTLEERAIKNVFPIRLWLAGIPQAEVPFKKEVIMGTLATLDPERFLAYHRQKKLFSPAAVGAQLERINLIRSLFEEELKKDKPTLTPKALFLKLVNNHPSYAFLKETLKLKDCSAFMLLGQIPEDADWSIIRHPLQTWGIWARAIEANNQPSGGKFFSNETFATSAAPKFILNQIAESMQMSEQKNPTVYNEVEAMTEEIRRNTIG